MDICMISTFRFGNFTLLHEELHKIIINPKDFDGKLYYNPLYIPPHAERV